VAQGLTGPDPWRRSADPVPGDPVIAFEGFGFRHVSAAEPALRGVTLELRRGEYVGVLGAAGAGVSTLLAAVNGVVPQLVRGDATGSIRVLGHDPRVVPVRAWASRVGVVLDDPSLTATQASVADEVAFGLENLGVPRDEMDARIGAALLAVGLGGFEARVPRTLSGGEQQRLAIACALATGPSILVLDEPSANLDPGGRRLLYDALGRLSRDHGVTVLVADQAVESLAADATRLVVLEEGRVVADGAPEVVLGDPAMLAGHGVRSTDTALLGAALGIRPPVPTAAPSLVPRLRRRPAAGATSTEPAPTGDAVIAVDGVTYRYPGAPGPAIAGVSLRVAAGEVVGLVGANGCGKTTLARLVAGLARPERGRVAVAGLDAASAPPRALAALVGLAFQDPAHQLFASTVADELALGPRAMGWSEARIEERVRELAASLDLGGLMGRHPLHLGRADRRLVALAAVLASSPRVLVLDEPTTGADARLALVIEGQVDAAAASGCAVLVASHDMAFLGRVASRLVVLDGGRVLADAPTRTIFTDAPLLAVTGLEAPAVTRIALALELGPSGGRRWPPVTVEEAAAVLEAPRRSGGGGLEAGA
jgi:energy-coupling factor transport system ATP-binding protein